MYHRLVKIFNGKVITLYRIIPDGTVIIKEGIISDVAQGNIELENGFEIDARGQYVAPGFINIYLHGRTRITLTGCLKKRQY